MTVLADDTVAWREPNEDEMTLVPAAIHRALHD
jgi:hypothetical protein